MHKAVREALVNMLVNTDYFLPRGVVIRKTADEVILENPGSIRTGKDQMLRGGVSDPRNKTLLKMFNMIGFGERAGSGVPDIFSVWESQKWDKPSIEEQYGSDRTILTLRFLGQNDANHDANDAKNRDRILTVLKVKPESTQIEIAKEIGISRATVQREMKKMVEEGIIIRIGATRGHWELKD